MLRKIWWFTYLRLFVLYVEQKLLGFADKISVLTDNKFNSFFVIRVKIFHEYALVSVKTLSVVLKDSRTNDPFRVLAHHFLQPEESVWTEYKNSAPHYLESSLQFPLMLGYRYRYGPFNFVKDIKRHSSRFYDVETLRGMSQIVNNYKNYNARGLTLTFMENLLA